MIEYHISGKAEAGQEQRAARMSDEELFDAVEGFWESGGKKELPIGQVSRNRLFEQVSEYIADYVYTGTELFTARQILEDFRKLGLSDDFIARFLLWEQMEGATFDDDASFEPVLTELGISKHRIKRALEEGG